MKRIFIFPTIEEAKAFILTEPRDPVFVGGVGMAEIAAATLRAVKAKKPQLVVLAGIAGACDRTLRRGEVVEVVCERIAGIPERYAREYETSGPDLGLPLAAGVTVNRSGNARNQPGNMAAPIGFETPDDTERTALGTQPGIPDNAGNLPQKPEGSPEDTPQEYLPEVENMEGAAFFAVCDALGVACCQIRAVSNYVGEPFGQWAVEEAVGNLTEFAPAIQRWLANVFIDIIVLVLTFAAGWLLGRFGGKRNRSDNEKNARNITEAQKQ